jgi:hypothetical protein
MPGFSYLAVRVLGQSGEEGEERKETPQKGEKNEGSVIPVRSMTIHVIMTIPTFVGLLDCMAPWQPW